MEGKKPQKQKDKKCRNSRITISKRSHLSTRS
jgi:hypothetical protein